MTYVGSSVIFATRIHTRAHTHMNPFTVKFSVAKDSCDRREPALSRWLTSLRQPRGIRP